jgi:DNA polymerase-3 subunit beta
MKFQVSSGDFSKTLGKVTAVVPQKSTLPILESVYFSLTKNTLSLTGTDLEIAMVISMDVKGSRGGQLCVPAKKLAEIIRVLPNGDITFDASVETKRVTISSSNGEYKLTCDSAEEFPSVPQLAGAATSAFTVATPVLKKIASTTLFAVSTDELRPSMTGVYFNMKKNETHAVATDGLRLVRVVNPDLKAEHAATVVVPAKALGLVSRSFESESVAVSLSDTHIQFAQENITIVSRIIDEKYPNYESVIPLDNDKTMQVNRRSLAESVKRVALFSNSLTHQIRFKISPNLVRVLAEDVDAGDEAKEEIACAYAGAEMEIGFNSKYVEDALSHLDADEVKFTFSSPTRACTLHPADTENVQGTLMLIMPVRLNR